MTTLKNLKGTAIQFLDADPVEYAGSWATGGNLNTAKRQGAGFGTLTAGVNAGGNNPPPTTANVEEYNGTAWSEVNDMPTSHFALASATNSPQTSGIVFGGTNPTNNGVSAESDSYDGTNWTETAELNTGRKQLGGSGSSSTSALAFGGNPSPGVITELWNGSSWTEVNDLNTAKSNMGDFGTSTAAIAAAGTDSPGVTTTVEQWNGTNWTEVAELNSNRTRTMGAGTTTDGIVAGGGPPNSALTEAWNGTTWTEVNDMATARFESGSAGTGAAAFVAGGYTTTEVATTEEWSFPAITATIVKEGQLWFNSSSLTLKGYGTAAGIPAATWASGGTLNAGHGYGTGFGSQTAAVCCFGGYPTHTNNTETYNGTAWTEVNEGNTARRNLGSFGILTSGLAFGGYSTASLANTEQWNGTSWTEVNDLPTTVYNNRGIGASSSSGISFGGVDAATPGKSKKAHEWNGSSWTAITDMGTIRESGMGANAGTATAALAFGGESPTLTANTELWNGTSWTELNNLNTARADAGGNGISTGALCFGGNPPSAPPYQATINEFWNGTSWTELNDLGTGIGNGIAPAGGSVSGMASGGLSNPTTQNTVSQEWTASAAVATVTTS